MSDLYDQDDPLGYDAAEAAALEYEREQDRTLEEWGNRWAHLFPTKPKRPTIVDPREALEREHFLLWEHELSQPNYYDYFLEEVTR